MTPIEDWVEQQLGQAPPLTPEQIAVIAAALRRGAEEAKR